MAVMVALPATAVYLAIPLRCRQPAAEPDKYALLADALLHGRLHLETRPANAGELARDATGRWYVVYPPVPAALIAPLIAMTGPTQPVWPIVSIAAGCLVFVTALTLHRWRESGLIRASERTCAALALFAAFGTMLWHVTLVGRDWHLAHVLGAMFFMLAMYEYAGAQRWMRIGLLAALAGGCRPTMLLAGLFFPAAILLQGARGARRGSAAGAALLRLALFPAVMIAAYLGLNWLRFGSGLDFGYERMVLQSPGREMLAAYGQFNRRLIPYNFYWYYLAPPIVTVDPASGVRIGYSLMGMSQFVASPALLMIFAARRPRGLVRAAWIGNVACVSALLMYYNTGYVQFGHRFGMDYLPLMLLLLASAVGARVRIGSAVLMALSVLIQLWGVGAYVGWWPGVGAG